MHWFTGPLRRRRRNAGALVVLAGICVMAMLWAPTGAGAHAVPSSGGPWGPIGLSRPIMQSVSAPGPKATPVSRPAVSSALRRATGYSLSQVSTENACSRSVVGHASCLAKLLVVNGTGQPVRPLSTGFTPSSPVQPQGQLSPMAEPPATSAPQLGTPAYIQQAYDLSYLAATRGGSDTIAVVDAYDNPTAEQDLQTFRAQYGLPTCSSSNGCFTEVNQSGNSSPLPSSTQTTLDSWGVESALDLDAVSAICPNCHIIYVETSSDSITDLQAGASAAASLGANQISMSFGGVSLTEPTGTWTFAGVSSFASAGDRGYVGSGQGMFPAADPGVTAVGGTELVSASNARGFDESAWSGGGSGCATSVSKPSWQTDSGCAGRAFTDVSADGAPATGLGIYDSSYSSPGWLLVGGTSMAAPMTAAYAALTGVDGGHTPQWAYTDSAALNDIVSGSNGSCGTYVCTAGTGYDGPTGNGSISGDVVAGGPGAAGAHATGLSADWTSIELTGGLYPNGLDTTYHWEYGTTTAYGHSTASSDAGAGSSMSSVSTALSGLTPGTTYHFRLVATNADATVYGYDETFHTFGTPQVSAAPSIASASGNFEQGTGLLARTGTWNPSGTVSLAWIRCRSVSGSGSTAVGTGCSSISGATAGTYTPSTADVNGYLELAVTETNTYGSKTATSKPVGPISGLKPVVVKHPHLAVSGRSLQVAGGSYDYGSVASIRFERCALYFRCAHTTQTTVTYRPRAADQGRYIRARVKVKGPGGSALVLTNTFLLLSADAGLLTVRAGHHARTVVRGTTRHPLARVVARSRHGGRAVRFTVHAIRHRRIVVWACSSLCVAHHRLRGTASITDRHVSRGERVRLIVVRQRRHARLRHVRFRSV